MKRSLSYSQFVNPFLLWSDLTVKTGEMMLASAEVIGHRTARMAVAGVSPSQRDRREFSLMGQEKVDAAAESGSAVLALMGRSGARLCAQAASQMQEGVFAMLALSASRTPSQFALRQAQMARTMTQSMLAGFRLGNTAALVAHSALQPIHSRTTRNVRRLRGR